MPNANALPAAGGGPVTVSKAWEMATQEFGALYGQAQFLINAISQGDVRSDVIANSEVFLATINNRLTTYAALISGASGGVAYVQGQNQKLANVDVVAGFQQMQAALIAAGSWIIANFPKDPATQKLLYVAFASDGTVTYDMFPQAALAPLSALMTALAATILAPTPTS